MRIGIIGLLHESNTFSSQPTSLRDFEQDLLLEADPILERLADSHHELGGFINGLAAHRTAGVETVPIFVARAIPSGTIAAFDFESLVSRLLDRVAQAPQLDGVLVAPHGATVSERHRDADGYWLSELHRLLGEDVPIVGTLDAHANLSARMVQSCHALLAYRTNPHLDQRQRGYQAAEMIVRTVTGQVRPCMSALFPPMLINIDRQCTNEPPLRTIVESADRQLEDESLLSNSLLLGFPYADVAEMGSASIAIADDDWEAADRSTRRLAHQLWESRQELQLQTLTIDEALEEAGRSDDRVCLLDMGDNVGGGSAADGTALLAALSQASIGKSFVCIFDPRAVRACQQAGTGAVVTLDVGGKTDTLHGAPVSLTMRVRSLHDGRFQESQPRHGGFVDFDQGPTAVAETDSHVTVMLTSRRMVPFSLQQLRSCDLAPEEFRILVAKGVNAPIAAYQEACDRMLRVNTPGSTTADVSQLDYQFRRRPLYPLEANTQWSAMEAGIVHGRSMGR